MVMTFPKTNLRVPFDASGKLVPMEEGTRRAVETIYVDQMNGADTNNGRSWAAAKATLFGVDGAVSVMADGDTLVIRAGHSEALAGITIVALSLTKWIVEGPEERSPETDTGGGQFTITGALDLDFIGQGNEFHFLTKEAGTLTVSGARNYLRRCAVRGGTGGCIVSGVQNVLEDCSFAGTTISLTVSGTHNQVIRPIFSQKGPVNRVADFGALAVANLMIDPISVDATVGTASVIRFLAGSTRNVLMGLSHGPGAFLSEDLGTNAVLYTSASGERIPETVEPEVSAAAVTVTGGVGANVFGATADIIAAGVAPTTDYEFLGLLAILNQVDVYHIEVQDTGGVVLAEFEQDVAAVTTRFNEKLSVPVRVRGGVGIRARLKTTGGGSDTAALRVKIRS